MARSGRCSATASLLGAAGAGVYVGRRGRKTMKDATTKQPLRVSSDGTDRPYLWVPLSRLDEVRRLLDSGKIPYWLDEIAIARDDEPEVVFVEFGRGAD